MRQKEPGDNQFEKRISANSGEYSFETINSYEEIVPSIQLAVLRAGYIWSATEKYRLYLDDG
jgi:hypothetical protein